jgi:hypothetical protein
MTGNKRRFASLETGSIVAANADLLPQIRRELASARKSLAA